MSSAPQVIQYSTVQEIVTLFGLPPLKAGQLLDKTVAVLQHSKCEPKGVAKKEDRVAWVLDGLDTIVCVFLRQPRCI